MGHSWLKVSTVVNCSSYVSIFALSIKRSNRGGNDNKHYFCQQIPSMGQTQFREETQIQSLESFSFVLLISIIGICFHTVFHWNNGYVWLPLLKKLILSVYNSIPPWPGWPLGLCVHWHVSPSLRFLWFCLNTVSSFRLRSWVFMEIWSIFGWTQRLLWGSSCQNANMMTQLSKQETDKCLWRVCTLQPYTQTTGMPFTNHHSQKGWLCAKLPCKRHHNFFFLL